MTKTTPEHTAGLPARLDALAAKTIAAIPLNTELEDLSFGALGGLSKAMRAIETAEGLTLETAARLILCDEQHIVWPSRTRRSLCPRPLLRAMAPGP